MQTWNYIVHLHETGDWRTLMVFWGSIGAFILLVLLLFLLARSRVLAVKAIRTVRALADDMGAAMRELDELERRMEKRLDSRSSELEERMTRKLDQKGDLIQERLEQRAAALSDNLSKLDARMSQTREQIAAFRERVDEVESRIPNLFDKLDEFRNTLATTFQAELGGVLNSFDSSIAAVLQQMKSDLQMGVNRIESIESMVRSREAAEQSLLGAPGADALEGPTEEEEFQEWEEEAKELAGQPEDESFDEELVELGSEQEESGPEEPEEGGYPAEAGEEAEEEEPEEPEEEEENPYF